MTIESLIQDLVKALEANTEVQNKILEKLNSAPAVEAKPKRTRAKAKPKAEEPKEDPKPKPKAEEPKEEPKPKPKAEEQNAKAEEPKAKAEPGKAIPQDKFVAAFRDFLAEAKKDGKKDEALALVKEISAEYGADRISAIAAADRADALKDLEDRKAAVLGGSDDDEELI